MAKQPDDFEPTEADIDMIVEDFTGKPVKPANGSPITKRNSASRIEPRVYDNFVAPDAARHEREAVKAFEEFCHTNFKRR